MRGEDTAGRNVASSCARSGSLTMAARREALDVNKEVEGRESGSGQRVGSLASSIKIIFHFLFRLAFHKPLTTMYCQSQKLA